VPTGWTPYIAKVIMVHYISTIHHYKVVTASHQLSKHQFGCISSWHSNYAMGWTIRGLNFFMDKKMSSSQHPD
jgi:hypothetical protein